MQLMCDSGAFSAFTQKKQIDLAQYIQFVKTNQKYIDHIINLDVINPQNPDVAAEAGMKNYLEMKGSGVDSIPVFHARESLKWLDQMMDLTDYVGISGTSLVSPAEDRAFHRITWQYITDNEGYPVVKTHSFGNVSSYTMLTFPFQSSDAATWMIAAGRAGRVRLQGKSYQLRSNTIGDPNFISDEDTGLKREMWEQEITELGLCPSSLMKVKAKGAELAMLRSFLVASDLLKLKEQTRNVNRFIGSSSIISNKRQTSGGIKRVGPIHFYFVLSPSAHMFNFPVLAALNVTHLLASYYYVITATKGFWEEKLLPFIADPKGFCESDKKTKRYWDKLQECILKPKADAVLA